MFDPKFIAAGIMGFVGLFIGFMLGKNLKPRNEKAVSWKDLNVIPIGVPFETVCRPVKLPDHAIIRFLANPEPFFVELPEIYLPRGFTLDTILSKMELLDQPVLLDQFVLRAVGIKAGETVNYFE